MKNHQPDYFFVSAIFALVIFGLVALASASAVISQENFGESYYYLKHQIIYGLSIGVIGFFICQRINYQFWKKIAWPLLILSLILLAGVFLPGMGYEGNEARRWITVGPISLQPFEFVKLAFILYFSAILSRKGEVKKNIKP